MRIRHSPASPSLYGQGDDLDGDREKRDSWVVDVNLANTMGFSLNPKYTESN